MNFIEKTKLYKIYRFKAYYIDNGDSNYKKYFYPENLN